MILGKNNGWCHAWVEKSGRMGERVDACACRTATCTPTATCTSTPTATTLVHIVPAAAHVGNQEMLTSLPSLRIGPFSCSSYRQFSLGTSLVETIMPSQMEVEPPEAISTVCLFSYM